MWKTIKYVGSEVVWAACCRISDDDLPVIVEEARKFDFCHLPPSALGQMTEFLTWLNRRVWVGVFQIHIFNRQVRGFLLQFCVCAFWDVPDAPNMEGSFDRAQAQELSSTL
ncbi:hypothetical protein P691DRAFT_782802 [Macrolepiota fuliginosa MF-IS2]|uniref:Uncharacterized protein n=1 Tax=Macrolepiota fuliginosa MF-IS2 TaxID=1400762 RepID=A0A9P6BWB7_9AGAR|nr:hypothetical protein P691DRAFT_782802 [Macrolepiota fuliginosa MF-IS2]